MDKRELYSEDEIITLSFDDGDEFECGIMGVFDVDGIDYIALEDLKEDDVYLYLYIETENGFELGDIPEEAFDRVSQEFDKLMEESVEI